MEGEVVRLLGDLAGEDPEVGAGEGVGVLTILEGVEVALWRAGAAGAEFEVAVGTAVGMAVGAAAHGPGATVGGLATGFVRVSWHGGVIIARMF